MSGRVRAAVGAVGELCITAGVLVLLFVTWQLWWTDVAAADDQRAAVAAVQQTWSGPAPADAPAPEDAPVPAEPPVLPEPAQDGEGFAVVHVPRFGEGWQVAAEQGVGLRAVLNDGVLGHYAGTAMPGGLGNFALAGHRTTYGAPLSAVADLQVGDPLVVETADGWYVYRVSGTEVVSPDRVDVIAAVPGDPAAAPTQRLITLTACHPRFSARQRYVVHGVLDSFSPRDGRPPAALGAGSSGGV